MNGITYREGFTDHPEALFELLRTQVEWDERMHARKTASYGVAYNYSQIRYPDRPFLPVLQEICGKMQQTLGFTPNNCLLNYYEDGNSTMGFHSDQTDILEANTGVAIVSLGEARILRFRRIKRKEETQDFELASGSLFYMTQEVQHVWQHAIPKSDRQNSRMSLTFRRIKA